MTVFKVGLFLRQSNKYWLLIFSDGENARILYFFIPDLDSVLIIKLEQKILGLAA